MPSPVHPYGDYGVALRTLKSARGWLGFMLCACVVAQFIGFALMWWTQQPYVGMKPELKPTNTTVQKWSQDMQGWWKQTQAWLDKMGSGPITAPSTTAPVGVATVPSMSRPPLPPEEFFPGTEQSRSLNVRNQWAAVYTMTVPVTQLAGLIAVSSQAIIVFVTLLVVLVAQAPGVAQITRSLIWSVLLLFMFLPWQYFARDFPIPGVIYSYTELLRSIGPHVTGEKVYLFMVLLVYGRFVVWPLMGLLTLLITAERYRAGVMIAIGHPLQSILQPRGNGGAMGAKGGTTMGVQPRPMIPLSGK